MHKHKRCLKKRKKEDIYDYININCKLDSEELDGYNYIID